MTPFRYAGTGCSHTCACRGACYYSELFSELPQGDALVVTEAQQAPEAPLAEGHAMERQDAASQRAWDSQMPTQPWQSGLQQAGAPQHISPGVSRDSHTVKGRPVLQSRVVWAPLPAQPATSTAVHPPAAPFTVIGQEHEQSLPPPRAGMPAQQDLAGAAAERSDAGGGSLPAQRSHAAAKPLQLNPNHADLHPWASHIPEAQDMSLGVGCSLPIRGAEGSPSQGTPNLDLLNSIDMLMQQLPPFDAAALRKSDPAQSASLPGPPSMLSAAGMEPTTPQP